MIARLRYDVMRRKDCFGHVHVGSVIGKEQAKGSGLLLEYEGRAGQRIDLGAGTFFMVYYLEKARRCRMVKRLYS